VLVFGVLVFLSNLLVYLGLKHDLMSLALLGRMLFGVFSAALSCKLYRCDYTTESIHLLFGKWQSQTKHGPYHLLSKIASHIGVILAIIGLACLGRSA
jgi:hypothetical protein